MKLKHAQFWDSHKTPITCSWHQKTKPPIHQLTNLKCCKISFKAFKMKKQGWKCFFKVRNNTLLIPLTRVLKGSLAFLQHSKFVNWWIRGFGFFWCHEQVIYSTSEIVMFHCELQSAWTLICLFVCPSLKHHQNTLGLKTCNKNVTFFLLTLLH